MANVTKKKNIGKKTSNTTNKAKVKKNIKKVEFKLPFTDKILSKKRNLFITVFLIFVFAVLLIVSSYAWFSTTLNVKIKTFNMLVTKNDGLSISHDAVTYGNFIEISKELLYDNLEKTYPNHRTIWNANGLIPVSTNGNSSRNSYFFDVYTTTGVFYKDFIKRTGAVVTTKLYDQSSPKKYSYFLSFDVFFLNDTGSPIADNLYFADGTGFSVKEDIDEEMQGLINSLRIGIVKVGSLPKTASPNEVQNIQCNNDCEAIIFEPFKLQHTDMAIDNAAKYGIKVVNGEEFPTYANVNVVNKKPIEDTIYGSDTLDTNNFKLQETITELDFYDALFTVPDGYTKARIYVWIEGQDIDSLETLSSGTDVDISVNFVKDTLGYDSFDEER